MKISMVLSNEVCYSTLFMIALFSLHANKKKRRHSILPQISTTCGKFRVVWRVGAGGGEWWVASD